MVAVHHRALELAGRRIPSPAFLELASAPILRVATDPAGPDDALEAARTLTVLTNSMEVATILRQGPSSVSVLVTGGAPSADGTLLGSLTVRAIQTLNTDLAFVWTTGIDVDRGITVDSMLESDAATAILHSTKRSVALATRTAIGEIRLAHVCPLDDVDAVIVSGPLAPRPSSTSGRARAPSSWPG